jgi:uncharacterized protein (TIGR00255 family)
MIRSMTAFASAEAATPWGQFACELRSVNHRYLEVSVRLPEEFRALEPRLRDAVAQRMSRGKLDLNLRWKREARTQLQLKLNEPLARELARLAREFGTHAPDLAPGSRLEALGWPGMIIEPEGDAGAQHQAWLDLLERVLEEFVAARAREGERLAVFLNERLDGIARTIGEVREWLPEIRTSQRTRLENKLAEIQQPADPGRLEQELVLALSKLDVDEELDRLSAHVAEARAILARPEPAGRRLDFMLQEFNREANTLGSKSVDQRTTRASVELKVLIEQLREQVQNIE